MESNRRRLIIISTVTGVMVFGAAGFAAAATGGADHVRIPVVSLTVPNSLDDNGAADTSTSVTVADSSTSTDPTVTVASVVLVDPALTPISVETPNSVDDDDDDITNSSIDDDSDDDEADDDESDDDSGSGSSNSGHGSDNSGHGGGDDSGSDD
jgi:uncharacterized membrane protein YgcG